MLPPFQINRYYFQLSSTQFDDIIAHCSLRYSEIVVKPPKGLFPRATEALTRRIMASRLGWYFAISHMAAHASAKWMAMIFIDPSMIEKIASSFGFLPFRPSFFKGKQFRGMKSKRFSFLVIIDRISSFKQRYRWSMTYLVSLSCTNIRVEIYYTLLKRTSKRNSCIIIIIDDKFCLNNYILVKM